MSYKRVIPRDLFNEANFLKCLGQLALIIHDKDGKIFNIPFSIEYDGGPFELDQNESGDLICNNFKFFMDKEEIKLSRPLNSRDTWPLVGFYRNSYYYIFNDKGELGPNFGHKDYKYE